METFKIGICEPLDFSKKALERLAEVGEVELFEGRDLKSFIKDKNAIFVRLKYAIDNVLIEEAHNLKYICSPTTGLNHIMLSDDRCKIISLKGEYEFLNCIRATPEHVFGLTLGLLRNYVHAFLNVDNNVFDRNPYKGYEIYGNTIGIIGMGRIGKLLVKYFNAFGAKVYYYDIEEKYIEQAQACQTLETLIANSNIVILCANYTKENEKMIGDDLFSLMKNKYFINAARGELVDEKCLLSYIERNWFKGVAIDVISNETSDSYFLRELLNLAENKNIIITPHIGGATFSSMERTEEFIVEKLLMNLEEKN